MLTNGGKVERFLFWKFLKLNTFVDMAFSLEFPKGCCKRREKVMNSKFLKNMIKCLNKGSHSHMLNRRGYLEFEITFKHMKDPTWTRKDISLFMEMDFLYKPKRHENKKFPELCKGRFKANMRKLCELGVLKEEICDETDTNMKKSVKKKRYKFMKMYDELNPATDESNAKKEFLDACKDIEDEENIDVLSHSLCLSNNASHGEEELNPNKKQEVQPLSLFERGISVQEVTEAMHSFECPRNKEMEIIMFAENVEHQPLLAFCKDVKDNIEMQNKVIVFSDVQHSASKEMEVVTDMLGENEESVDLNNLIYGLDESQESMKNKFLLGSSSDPILPIAYKADHYQYDDAILSVSEFKTYGSAFSFSQNEGEILSMYG